jgi:signal peptidase I
MTYRMTTTLTENSSSDKQATAFLEFRETVESLVVAIILALLFRAFIAEAFVIPTGSMAPTLMGRHVDVACNECQLRYQTSASIERTRDDKLAGYKVVSTRCPSCGFRKDLDIKPSFSNEHSFSGDRIIVNKFAYELHDPRRWEVIVFKFPGEAKQNYIKRLIGLPNETIKIEGGNIYVKAKDATEFTIARKPPHRLLAMLQLVHDSNYVAPQMEQAGWPQRWQPVGNAENWEIASDSRSYTLKPSENLQEIRYHHVDPAEDLQYDANDDWLQIIDHAKNNTKINVGQWNGGLITDFYAYNSAQQCRMDTKTQELKGYPFLSENSPDRNSAYGLHWVDDLALECQADITSNTGELNLDLVRGGTHYTCTIDVSTGKAKLSTQALPDQPTVTFSSGEKSINALEGNTPIRGAGAYHLRFSNVDHELLLWVNNTLVTFSGQTAYDAPALILPHLQDRQRGDLAPAGVGGKNVAVTFSKFRVLRDKYYLPSANEFTEYAAHPLSPIFSTDTEEQARETVAEWNRLGETKQILSTLRIAMPETLYPLLNSRKSAEFVLQEDQFMPMGDNSPASYDARSWTVAGVNHNYVERHLLVGRAVCVYWPHSWWSPCGWPNFQRMQPIR